MTGGYVHGGSPLLIIGGQQGVLKDSGERPTAPTTVPVMQEDSRCRLSSSRGDSTVATPRLDRTGIGVAGEVAVCCCSSLLVHTIDPHWNIHRCGCELSR